VANANESTRVAYAQRRDIVGRRRAWVAGVTALALLQLLEYWRLHQHDAWGFGTLAITLHGDHAGAQHNR